MKRRNIIVLYLLCFMTSWAQKTQGPGLPSTETSLPAEWHDLGTPPYKVFGSYDFAVSPQKKSLF